MEIYDFETALSCEMMGKQFRSKEEEIGALKEYKESLSEESASVSKRISNLQDNIVISNN